VLMRFLGANMLYAFVCGCALILVLRVRPERVTHLHQVEDAPLHHIPMPDSTTSSPLTAALDPRVAEEVVQEQMHDSSTAPGAEENGAAQAAAEPQVRE